MHIKVYFFLSFFLFHYTTQVCSQIEFSSAYEKYKEEGDTYLLKKDFINAKKSYQLALKSNPKDEYSLNKISFCEAALRKQHSICITAADKHFEAGNLNRSLKYYREALMYTANGDSYALKQISICEKSMKSILYKSYGGENYDDARAIVSTSDGGYMLAGVTSSGSKGSSDVSLTKVDSEARLVWIKNFGEKETDTGEDLIRTSDGNYLIAGSMGSTGSSGDSINAEYIWIIKADEQGNKVWDNIYGENSSMSESFAVAPTHDGNFIIAGNTINSKNNMPKHAIVCIKIDMDGSTIWQNFYETELNQQAYGIVSTSDGFTIIANKEVKENKKRWDIWLLHIDKFGNRVWDSSYGGQDNDIANALLHTKDGGYIITGYTYTFASASRDVWIIKTNGKGERIWEKTYGGDGIDEGYSIIETNNGGYLIVGYTEVWEGNKFGENSSKDALNAYLIKLSPEGEKEWIRSLGGEGEQRLYDVLQTKKGDYIAVGVTEKKFHDKDMLILKIKEQKFTLE